ncbi:MAG: cupin domain-containing protein [Bacteroidetes bacterium]|nr:MAG: cupin domain-containing protein [Bacteroidota bacterium]
MKEEIQEIIKHFNLQAHPEGGYYIETFRSSEGIFLENVSGITGFRNFLTGIYFLITSENFSAFHRIKQDEPWHFYAGGGVSVYVISPEGILTKHKLGSDFKNGEAFQVTIPAHHWFAARVEKKDNFAFVGCNVAPGFDFADFELANRQDLINAYPIHKNIIEELTR